MREITIEELNQYLLDGRRAAQYAWDHYDELAARKTAYTLYGPKNYGIGAGIPGKFIPQRARKLSLKTRRKDYLVYELDHDYKLLRVTLIQNYDTQVYTYHCFELDGIQYACPFSGTERKFYWNEILAIGYHGTRPWYLGFLRERSLIVQYFEYCKNGKMEVTTYSYSPTTKYTVHGYLVDLNAPIGALNSPAERGHWEEVEAYTDFSKWFQ